MTVSSFQSTQMSSAVFDPDLEAVLFSHDPLSLPLVAGLPGCPDTLGGQVAPRRPSLPLSQVQVSHLQTHLIAHQVLQLYELREIGGEEMEKRTEKYGGEERE